MDGYDALRLTKGGGLTAGTMKPAGDGLHLFLGLGGTGIECLRTLKTRAREWLALSELAEAPFSLFGIDTDDYSRTAGEFLLPLEEQEFLWLHYPGNLGPHLRDRTDLAWLQWNEIPDLETGRPVCRQHSRFFLMEHWQELSDRLLDQLQKLRSRAPQLPIFVHVITSMSGLAGSGCFLDLCYLLRKLVEVHGLERVFLCGWFFLPETILSRIPDSDVSSFRFVSINSYAALRELDYCMNLPENGSSFTQVYKNGMSVPWDRPPVDLACLVGLPEQDPYRGYRKAMENLVQYLMGQLLYPGFAGRIADFQQRAGQAWQNRTDGSRPVYGLLQSNAAMAPLREVQTNLAALLFEKWNPLLSHLPAKQDVEQLICRAFGSQHIGDLYQTLYFRLTERADDGYTPYPDGWKYVRENGNSRFVQHYTDQTANKLGQITSNQKSLLELGNQESIVAKICRQLNDAVVDLDRGPSYAWQTLNAAQSHNLLNIVDGLIRENTERQSQEAAQHNLRHTDYENAKAAFDGATGLFSNPGRAFGAYEFYLKALEQHDRMMGVYDAMDKMLRNLRRQLEELAAGYYVRLARVVETLMNSFKENYTLLVGKQQLKTTHFGTPMMSIEDLRPMLDRAVEEMNLRNKMQEFMEMLLQNSDQWLQEDERKITKLVTRFLVKDTFSEFASRTITSYLSIKYHTDNVDVLTQKIYDDWMLPLDNRAQPLFYLNGHIWSQVSELKQVSVPAEAAPVRMAAENAAAPLAWDIKPSQLTDRIYVMRTACALPLAAYQKCETYERDAYSIPEAGRHYYEGKGTEKMPFGNWQDLPTLTPLCLLPATLPDKLTKMVKRVRSVFEQARAAGLIGDEGQLYEQDTAAVQKLLEDAATLRQGLKNAAGLPEAEKVLKQLEEVAGSTLPMLPTEQKLLCDGYVPTQEARDIIMLDYLYQAPARIAELEVRLDLQKQLEGQVQEEIQQLKNTIYQLGKGARLQDAFFDAVFTDVIHLEGRVAVFIKQVSGISTEIYLSKRGEEFPFASIPVYQAFLSAQAMSEEDQKQMTRQVDDIYNTNAPILKENGARLKDELSVEQIQSWIQRAGDFPETAEITAFLTKLKQRFDLFCGEFKI